MGAEILRQAFSALRANWLRSLLTLSIIAFGIMAIVGILTAIDAAIFSLNDSFSSLGANSIEVREANSNTRGRRDGRQARRAEPIDFEQAQLFKSLFGQQAVVSISMSATGNATIKANGKETTPTIPIQGVDEDYFRVKKYDLEQGRSFSAQEARGGAKIAVIGTDIVKTLFNGRSDKAIGKEIIAGSMRLEIVGVLESKGSSSNSVDKLVIVPIGTARNAYGTNRTRYSVTAALPQTADLERGKSDAIGAMRVARGLSAKQENDFEVITSDSLIKEIRSNTAALQAGAVAIGLMTLLGAAIGLMNIMLVSVTERTREIGIIKALGASRRLILLQFLTEAVVLTQLGGLAGIIIGILIGNIVTLLAGGEFLIPWNWILLSFFVCLATGLLSGLYPAVKAARLDPIESLRYE